MCGSRRSVMTMSGVSLSITASAASELSASLQQNPSPSPMRMHSFRMLCSSSTIRKRMRKSSFMWFPKCLLYHGDELRNTKWLLYTGRSRVFQDRYSFVVYGIAGYEDDPRNQLRAIAFDPGMQIRAVDPTRSAHVGDYSQVFSRSQQLQTVGAASC